MEQPGGDSWVSCGKPSAWSGDEMGTNMVICDSVYGKLFYQSYMGYIEADKEEANDFWLY
jgi:hypothetical protein